MDLPQRRVVATRYRPARVNATALHTAAAPATAPLVGRVFDGAAGFDVDLLQRRVVATRHHAVWGEHATTTADSPSHASAHQHRVHDATAGRHLGVPQRGLAAAGASRRAVRVRRLVRR